MSRSTHNHLPTVFMGDIAMLVKRPKQFTDDTMVSSVGVKWYGKGVYVAEEKLITELRADRFEVYANDLIYNDMWARQGSVGIVPENLHGSSASAHFPTWELDLSRVFPPFLSWYFKTPSFWADCEDKSQGSTGRNAITKSLFRQLIVPLPPLEEQRRIVARIEELAAQIEEAQGLQIENIEAISDLGKTISRKVFEDLATKTTLPPIKNVIKFRNDLIRPNDGSKGTVRFIGLQHIESDTGVRIGEDCLIAEELTGRKFRFSPGEIVYGYLRPYLNKVWIADCEGVCSVDQYVIQPKSTLVSTEYLAHFMRSGRFLQEAIEKTHNLILPRLRTALLENILIPLPSIQEQLEIVEHLDNVQAQVNSLKQLQANSEAELNALLPSVLDKAFKGEL